MLPCVTDAYLGTHDYFWIGLTLNASSPLSDNCSGDWQTCASPLLLYDGTPFVAGAHWDGMVLAYNKATELCVLVYTPPGEIHDAPCTLAARFLCTIDCS